MKTTKIFTGLSFVIASVLITTISLSLAQENVKTRLGTVKQDPKNKQNISGSIHITRVQSPQSKREVFDYRTQDLGYLKDFKEYIEKYTNITVEIDGPIGIESSNLFRYPFVYFTLSDMVDKEFAQRENRNVIKYLRSGGFACIDYLRRLRDELLNDMNRDITIKPVPEEHLLYHCFYDITKQSIGRPHGLDGIWIHDELVGVCGVRISDLLVSDRFGEEEKKIVINMIVYSLIREGSGTKKELK